MRARALVLAVLFALAGLPLGDAGASSPRSSSASPGAWGWPLPGEPVVDRPFEPPASAWGAGHRGVDLRGELGQPVLAAGSGTVTYAGLLAGRGVVTVTHAGGLRTTYEPVDARVGTGDVVAVGDVLGTLATGHASCRRDVVCLHWGLLRGRTYLDPMGLVVGGPLQLLPIDDHDKTKRKKKQRRKRTAKEKDEPSKARKLLDGAKRLAKRTGKGVAKAGRAVGRVAKSTGSLVRRAVVRAAPTVARAVAQATLRAAAATGAAAAAPEVVVGVAVVVVIAGTVYLVRRRG